MAGPSQPVTGLPQQVNTQQWTYGQSHGQPHQSSGQPFHGQPQGQPQQPSSQPFNNTGSMYGQQQEQYNQPMRQSFISTVRQLQQSSK